MFENLTSNLTDCDLKFAQSEGAFSGYGSVFKNLDSKNDIIMPGAYSEVLKSGDPVPVYVNHGWLNGALPVGSWSNLQQDAKGLFGDANLVMQMPSAIDAYWAMKSKLANGLSVAIIPDHSSIERRPTGERIIHNIKMLKEISIVTDPANELSTVVSVKFREELDDVKNIKDFENFLRDAGGYSKGAAQILTAKAKELFGLRDADTQNEAKEAEKMLLDRFKRIESLTSQ